MLDSRSPTHAAKGARFTVERHPVRIAAIADVVMAGLGATPKSLPPILFYDARGSELFERITELDEYYVTRTERALLERHCEELAQFAGPEVEIVELGSGSSEKTELFLSYLSEQRSEVEYVPIDVSEAALEAAAARLTQRLPNLSVHGIIADYDTGLERLAKRTARDRLVMFMGGNLGNFDPPEAARFLQRLRNSCTSDDHVLLGIDLVKDKAVLERAYDDREGVTAEFNLNVLRRINRELGGQFELDSFVHRAHFDPEKSRVEMHLESTCAQEVRVEALATTFSFAKGETIHTESSYKLTPERIDALAARTRFAVKRRFVDDSRLFTLNLLCPS